MSASTSINKELTVNTRTPKQTTWGVRLTLSVSLAVVGLAASTAAYHTGLHGSIFLWGIMPGAPFIALAAVSLMLRVPSSATIGASIGCVLATLPPYGMLWYASATYSGGGANIGLGLLLLATTALTPLIMAIGMKVGTLVSRQYAKS